MRPKVVLKRRKIERLKSSFEFSSACSQTDTKPAVKDVGKPLLQHSTRIKELEQRANIEQAKRAENLRIEN